MTALPQNEDICETAGVEATRNCNPPSIQEAVSVDVCEYVCVCVSVRSCEVCVCAYVRLGKLQMRFHLIKLNR